ncbi:hypothetical protein N9L06_03995 [Mariniblastus sp.]|nr:hypothetical protein [Mariniblastus sp.]
MSDNLETRLGSLEQQVQVILSKLESTENQKDWRRSLGMFNDRPEMKQIDQEGSRIRSDDRLESVNDHS